MASEERKIKQHDFGEGYRCVDCGTNVNDSPDQFCNPKYEPIDGEGEAEEFVPRRTGVSFEVESQGRVPLGECICRPGFSGINGEHRDPEVNPGCTVCGDGKGTPILQELDLEKGFGGEIEVGNLTGCARCGGDHPGTMIFKALSHPEGVWTHWARCPTNGQPIMLRPEEDGVGDERLAADRLRRLDHVAAELEVHILEARGDVGALRREWRECQDEMIQTERGGDDG